MKIYIAGHRGMAGSALVRAAGAHEGLELVQLMIESDLALAEREKKSQEAGGSGSADG